MARMSLATSIFMLARDTYLGGQAVQITGKGFVTLAGGASSALMTPWATVLLRPIPPI
jgi:hypothetical protein